MVRKLLLYYNTVKYLRFKQFFYHLKHKLYKQKFKIIPYKKELRRIPVFDNGILNNQTYFKGEFRFIGKSKKFVVIDWNLKEYGKLWLYNLNYMDYINQKEISFDESMYIINDFIENINNVKDGNEPYPMSLRNINIIKFICKNRNKIGIHIRDLNNLLYNQSCYLMHNIEYHILGNHLLENGVSLLFAAYYFDNINFYKKGKKIITNELKEQILNDGGHFERSPMYHQIMLLRALDCINLINNNHHIFYDNIFFNLLLKKAGKMISWLKEITFKNGEIPLFNDSSKKIAPSSFQLFKYAERLNIPKINQKLGDSGFRKIETINYEIILNLGEIKATYQPGHSHSDLFTFCLNIDNQPIIIDTGISTYEVNETRNFERSTKAHNTVVLNNQNQSQVWSSFRVGKRAKIINFIEKQDKISVTHNGYRKLNATHQRNFSFNDNSICINDNIYTQKSVSVKSYIHFHPSVNLIQGNNHIKSGKIKIEFENYNYISIGSYNFANGFNQLIKAPVVIIDFSLALKTLIIITDN